MEDNQKDERRVLGELHQAIRLGDTEALTRVVGTLRSSPLLNSSVLGVLPLHHAAIRGFARGVEILLENGALPELPDSDGARAVHHAAIAENGEKLLAILLANGADLNATTYRGRTPLDISVAAGAAEASAFLRRHGGRSGGDQRPWAGRPSKGSGPMRGS